MRIKVKSKADLECLELYATKKIRNTGLLSFECKSAKRDHIQNKWRFF